ncbi:hypothetical protein [Brevundimonas diminuta]|uniref:hypothetical protein n=1 Tax=Brevundimonas diminuta TaxID=293 RepID=UPI003D9A1BCD
MSMLEAEHRRRSVQTHRLGEWFVGARELELVLAQVSADVRSFHVDQTEILKEQEVRLFRLQSGRVDFEREAF